MAPTVMIMTLNEEINIAGAIDSYPSGTPIVLYDSYSADATVDIARARGAKIVQRKFDNYAAHRSCAPRISISAHLGFIAPMPMSG